MYNVLESMRYGRNDEDGRWARVDRDVDGRLSLASCAGIDTRLDWRVEALPICRKETEPWTLSDGMKSISQKIESTENGRPPEAT